MASNYQQQIDACFLSLDLLKPLTLRRNQLIKEMRVIAKKLVELEADINKQSLSLQASNQKLDSESATISVEEILFIQQLADKDDYLSELVEAYIDELQFVESELSKLKHSLEMETLELAS